MITSEDKKELAEKKKKRFQNYKEWLTEFSNFFDELKTSNLPALAHIHENLPFVRKIEYTKHAAEILNQKYWDIVSNYLRLSLISSGKVDESKVINRYKVISATELTIMTIRPIIYQDGPNQIKNEETERFLNSLLAWFVAILIIDSWEEEDKRVRKTGNLIKSSKNIIKISTLFEPALRNEKVAISFRNEHIRWLAYVETDSYIPVLSNAQTWRMFYFCLQAMNNGLQYFTATTGDNPKRTNHANRRNPTKPKVSNSSSKISRN